jgi:ATP-dependent DNA helicase RecQ
MQAKDYLISLRGERRHNRWWAFLDEIWSEWASENGETEIPVPLIRDFFAEAIAERKRHHRIGEGVALLTAHKSKGLEFPHVFIIDGGWQRTVETVASEEERRVFYVSMTRAMENLVVMHRLDRRNQFTSEIEGEGVRDRIYQMKQNQLNPWYSRRYNLVTLDEIYLSFAGKTMSENPIHKALESAEVGDRVKLHQQGDWIYLINDSNIPLAALSSSGKKKWEPRLAHIEGAKITAIIRRTTSADGKDTENGVVVEDWEIPIVEVCWRLPDLN